MTTPEEVSAAVQDVSERLEPTSKAAIVRLADGSEYATDVTTIEHHDAKVHESTSHGYGSGSSSHYSSYGFYGYSSSYAHSSYRDEQKRPVVVADAKITFESGGRLVTALESQILAIEIPIGYTRYQDRYLTLKQKQEERERVLARLRAQEQVHDEIFASMFKYMEKTAEETKKDSRDEKTKRSFLDRLLGR